MEVKIPHTLAGMRVLRVLGQGAGSVIYEAKASDGQRFALKHTIRKTANDDRHIRQALHEFEVASQFKHENIRAVVKLHSQRGLGSIPDMIKHRSPMITKEVIIVMEMVDGETLEQHPVHDLLAVCKIFIEVARGLEALHIVDFVHADLKPHNIMFTPDGKVKLIDLGLACRNGEVRPRIHGTPGFIAPEQVIHQPVTPRTDVYSFGATMYNMLTHRLVPTVLKARPSDGKLTVEMTKDGSFPAPRDINPHVPPALSSLIMQCLKRKADERPHTISDVSRRLLMASKQVEDEMRPEPTLEELTATGETKRVLNSDDSSSSSTLGDTAFGEMFVEEIVDLPDDAADAVPTEDEQDNPAPKPKPKAAPKAPSKPKKPANPATPAPPKDKKPPKA